MLASASVRIYLWSMPARAASAKLRALPNIISSSRLLLAAGFAMVSDADRRLGLVGLAAATDFLDGWIARRAEWTTKWGALLDPIADRVFALVAVVTFVALGEVSIAGAVLVCLWLVGIASILSVVDYTYALWRARAR